MYQLTSSNGESVFTFVSYLDTASCSGKEEEIVQALGENPDKVVFDLSGVEYISSYFLRICTIMAKKIGAGKFKIANSSPVVKKVFKIAGFDQIMDVD